MPEIANKNWWIRQGVAFALGLAFDFRWVTDIFEDISWSNWWVVWLVTTAGLTFMVTVGVFMKHSSYNARKSGKSGGTLSPGVHATGAPSIISASAGATLHYLATLAWNLDAASLFLAFLHGTYAILNAAAYWLLKQSHPSEV